jgi:hypothetical protein
MRIRQIILWLFVTASCFGQTTKKNYHFNGNISEEALRNYLSHSITMTEICTAPKFKVDGKDNQLADDIRLIKNTGAKFIGRAIYRWGSEQNLSEPDFLSFAENVIKEVHAFDQDIIFQAAIFEAVSENVKKVAIPAQVFKAFGFPVEERNFDYEAMLYTNGLYKDQWGKGNSVPDVSKTEAKMWLYYLATKYIDAGFEGLHWGQVALMNANDKDLTHWFGMLAKIRAYATINACRHFVLNDAHTPRGGFIKDGKLLMDFHSFPLRIKEVKTQEMKGILQEGYLDALYNKSKGGITASGWECESLPYLVEFDNFGVSNQPGKALSKFPFVWGYDEITWFSKLTPESQKEFTEYAFKWVRKTDNNGYLQMPVCRMVVDGKSPVHKYKANIKSAACPEGTGLESKIKELWSEACTL